VSESLASSTRAGEGSHRPRAVWTEAAESGSIAALRGLAAFHRRFGRRASLALLRPAVGYFYLRRGLARRASRQYLDTLYASPAGRGALGHPPSPRDVYRHLFEFAVNIFDRMVTWGGGLSEMRFSHDRSGELFDAARSGRGGLLLSAHLGSFDMLRVLSDQHALAVNVIMYTRNAERINSFFERLDPKSRVRVISLAPGSVRTTFQIRSCIERGEFVAILADRVSPAERDRVATTTFLGRPTRFPLSPFLLPGVLGCPVYAALCVRTGDRSYRTVLRPLGDRGPVPRRERASYAEELLRGYARVLEAHCLETPFQWFNFYPYWSEEGT
jgi:predicted LPLAT superfamily acyltransferase